MTSDYLKKIPRSEREIRLEKAIRKISSASPRELLTQEQISPEKKMKLYNAVRDAIREIGLD